MSRATNSQFAVAHANANASDTSLTQIARGKPAIISSAGRLQYWHTLADRTRPHINLHWHAARSLMVLLSVILIFAATPAWPQTVNNFTSSADGRHCSDPMVEIDSLQPRDREAACAGAIEAKAFLTASGINTDGRINISMVSELADDSLNAYGYFDGQSEWIYVLNFDAARRAAAEAGMYGEPMDRDLHRSIVVHEVAHLMVNRNLSKNDPPLAAHEYIAYVSQFATMPLAVRNRVLINNPGEGFQANWQINSFDLRFAPNQFAVRAYQHYIQPENGTAFLRGILSGEIPVGIPLPL
ncbi:MAG: hypothetical protein HKN28_03155 [Alphaproteobacteria bacterium]|nr:hypothetical protein [Alphaproteobacteria bacterium]